MIRPARKKRATCLVIMAIVFFCCTPFNAEVLAKDTPDKSSEEGVGVQKKVEEPKKVKKPKKANKAEKANEPESDNGGEMRGPAALPEKSSPTTSH